MKIYFLIPAFNEAENIAMLLENIRATTANLRLSHQIFIVNDGSRDETAAIARAGGAAVLEHPYNRGPGAAFCTGFAHILPLCQEEDVLVTLEADNTSDLSILPQMLALLTLKEEGKGTNDVVLASVYAPGGGIEAPWGRKILSWCANRLLALVMGTPSIHTYSSFFRAYRPSCLKNAFQRYGKQLIQEQGFVSMVELLMKLHLLQTPLAEVPMVLNSRTQGASKMKVGRTLLAYGRVLWRYGKSDYAPNPQLPSTVLKQQLEKQL
jgi:dolichol-phosphate mannosyltransferase